MNLTITDNKTNKVVCDIDILHFLFTNSRNYMLDKELLLVAFESCFRFGISLETSIAKNRETFSKFDVTDIVSKFNKRYTIHI